MDIQRWFRTVDESGDGKIDVKELQRALAMGNLNFSLQACAQFIRLHDSDRSGTIDFQEFQSLHQFLMNMQQSFQHFDADRSGSLDRGEVYQALQHAGFRLDQHSFEAAFSSFDPDRSNGCSLIEFMGLSAFMKGTAMIYAAFDPQRRGTITLDYNQFVYAVVCATLLAKCCAGFRLDRHAFEALFTAFDPDRSATLSLTEYMGMTAFLQMSTHMFSGFDPQRRGVIQLDFNQWVYACANCR